MLTSGFWSKSCIGCSSQDLRCSRIRNLTERILSFFAVPCRCYNCSERMFKWRHCVADIAFASKIQTVETQNLPLQSDDRGGACGDASGHIELTPDSLFVGCLLGAPATRVYCHPMCPAHASYPESATLFPSAAAAQAAGFHPCTRCHPEVSGDAVKKEVEARISSGYASSGYPHTGLRPSALLLSSPSRQRGGRSRPRLRRRRPCPVLLLPGLDAEQFVAAIERATTRKA
jgi:hypothetical protein